MIFHEPTADICFILRNGDIESGFVFLRCGQMFLNLRHASQIQLHNDNYHDDTNDDNDDDYDDDNDDESNNIEVKYIMCEHLCCRQYCWPLGFLTQL